MAEAIKAATANPGKCLGIEGKGTLKFGQPADFILLSQDLNVLSTFVDGICYYTQL